MFILKELNAAECEGLASETKIIKGLSSLDGGQGKGGGGEWSDLAPIKSS